MVPEHAGAHGVLGDCYTVWLREMKRHYRDRARLISVFTAPLLWLVILGSGLEAALQVEEVGAAPIGFLTYLTPGMIAQVLLLSAITAGVSVLWDRRVGFLRVMLVAPISRVSIVLGKVLSGATTALMGGAVVIIVALALGALPGVDSTTGRPIVRGVADYTTAVLAMLLIAVAFVSLGIALGARLHAEFFQMFWGLLILPLIFLSSAFFPLETAPTWLRILGFLDPLTYGVDALRGGLTGYSLFPIDLGLLVLAGFSWATFAAALALFSRPHT